MIKQTMFNMLATVSVIGFVGLTNVGATTVVSGQASTQDTTPPGGSYPAFWTANFSTINDVLLGLTPAVVGDPTGGGYTTRSSLTDGVLHAVPNPGSGDYSVFQAVGGGGITELTYTLGHASLISSVQYYGGWLDNGRTSVNFLLSYSTDNGATYTSLIDPVGGINTVLNDPFDIQIGGLSGSTPYGLATFARHNGGAGPNANFVNVADDAGNLGDNALITNLKFAFAGSPTGNGWDGIQQLVAIEAVPEPGTFALVGGGLLSLIALRKRKAV